MAQEFRSFIQRVSKEQTWADWILNRGEKLLPLDRQNSNVASSYPRLGLTRFVFCSREADVERSARVASSTDSPTRMSAALSKGRLSSIGLAAAMALLLCLAHASIARGDPASCIGRVSAYVAELDQLLSKQRNWITPFLDLNDRYYPFLDCDVDALLEEVSRSPFIRPITYNPRTKEYFVLFSSRDVRVGFTYRASEKASNTHSAGWVDKYPSAVFVGKSRGE